MSLKKAGCILIFVLLGSTAAAQTLFSYNDHTVSKEEFLNSYKNASAKDDVKDYLNLYINLKLKVQAAKDLHLDTLSSFRADVEDYKNFLQHDFLHDEKLLNLLINEAAERSKKEIHIEAYYIPFSKADVGAKSEQAIRLLHQQVKAGTYNPTRFQQETGFIPEKADGGFITAFSLPYSLENIVYNLKPSQISEPLQEQNGWYILKNVGERKAAGTLTIAQILIYVPTDQVEEQKKAKALADSLYILIQKGESFEKLAKNYSDDKNSYSNDGVLPSFATGKYEKAFNEKAFNITADGATIPPFKSEFGYHILKRISLKPVPQVLTDAYKQEIRQKVLDDERKQIADRAFAQKIKDLTGAAVEKLNWDNLWKITDSALFSSRNIPAGNLNQNSTVISFNNGDKKTVNDWLLFAGTHFTYGSKQPHQVYKTLFGEFFEHQTKNNYVSRLDQMNANFKKRLEEYIEGNLVFEIMQKEIWGKAPEGVNGEEIADFQEKLEKKWVEKLRRKYNLHINEKVLNSL